MKHSLYAQAFCETCGIPVGFRGQGPAYARTDGGWDCEKHIDRERRRFINAGKVRGANGRY